MEILGNDISPKLMQTYQYIQKFYFENKIMPSIQELADEFGLVTSSSWERLYKLEAKGYIKRERNEKRSIKLLR